MRSQSQIKSQFDRAYQLRWRAFENIYPDVHERRDGPPSMEMLADEFVSFLLGPNSHWEDLMDATEENNEEIMRTLEMLAGPHGQTIWKAMQLRAQK